MKTNHSLFLILSVLLAMLAAGCGSPNHGSSKAVATPDLSNATVMASFGVPGDGNVLALGLMDTMRNLLSVVQGNPGTFVMEGPNGEYFLAWSMQSNTWGFLGLSQSGAPLDVLKMTGNYSNTMSFSDLVKTLETNGWTYATPAVMPAWLSTVLGSASAFVMRYGDIIASPIPIIIILPGGSLFDPTISGKG
jgi:hypothetical protein